MPLEVGIHALNYVPASVGGRGNKGGLSAYAEKIGKTPQFVGQLVNAARVTDKLETQVSGLSDKTKHLNEIHKLPESTWEQAVKLMLGKC